jgi:hypothetical protein
MQLAPAFEPQIAMEQQMAVITGLLDLLAVPGLGQEVIGHLGREVGSARLVCRALRCQVRDLGLHGGSSLVNPTFFAQVDQQVQHLQIWSSSTEHARVLCLARWLAGSSGLRPKELSVTSAALMASVPAGSPALARIEKLTLTMSNDSRSLCWEALPVSAHFFLPDVFDFKHALL